MDEEAINKKIKDHLKARKIKHADLAYKLGISSPVLHQRLNRNTIRVRDLYQVSLALKHNFFQEIASQLEEEIKNS